MNPPVVLVATAHPDDTEFYYSGTMLLLKQAGCEIHMWNLADGHCGSVEYSREEIIRIRAREARDSAAVAGAVSHPALFPDLQIFYDKPSMQAVAAVIRDIRPGIILTHSPNDYMEDHQNTCRLVVTGAFAKGMPNFETIPPNKPTYPGPVRIYHAPPHGLHDGLCRRFEPDFLIDTASVMDTKRKMLACHASQGDWLMKSQGHSFIKEMEQLSRDLVGNSGLEYAEAWRRHVHLGFCPADYDPLCQLLKALPPREA